MRYAAPWHLGVFSNPLESCDTVALIDISLLCENWFCLMVVLVVLTYWDLGTGRAVENGRCITDETLIPQLGLLLLLPQVLRLPRPPIRFLATI